MRQLIALTACALLAACAAEPVPYQPVADEIRAGAGLFSGPEGVFVLWKQDAKPSQTGNAKPGEAAPPGASAAPRNAAEEREYQEWREWKRRQENEAK